MSFHSQYTTCKIVIYHFHNSYYYTSITLGNSTITAIRYIINKYLIPITVLRYIY